jgi:hypothetical protein
MGNKVCGTTDLTFDNGGVTIVVTVDSNGDLVGDYYN